MKTNETIDCISLLADLWWIEYQDVIKDVELAIQNDDKLKALALTILAHKIREQYEYYFNRLIFE